MSVPQHRRQSSLETSIEFSQLPALRNEERAEAIQRFYRICVHFESKQPPATGFARRTTFSRPLLVKLTYEYSLNQTSQDGFLRAFFDVMVVPMFGDIATIDLSDLNIEADLEQKVTEFGDYLMDNFFLPLKAAFGKTPQHSPASHSAEGKIQREYEFIDTPARLASLRRACLERDRHRCVVSRAFDVLEADERFKTNAMATDDDGNVFPADEVYEDLQVTHIIPHALVSSKRSVSGTLNQRREAALKILNMFDQGVAYIIDGVEIDRPQNAMTLTTGMHNRFGSFQIFFTPVDGAEHTYIIDSFLSAPLNRSYGLPVRRTLFVTPDRAVDPPSPRLLAVHRAVAHILHLSGAGDYIDYVFRDVEEMAVRSDGTTPLGRLVNLGLSGLLHT